MSPRRIVQSGPQMSAGISTNLLFNFEGKARLTSKNEMENPVLNEFTPEGNLKGWVLDNPPQDTAWNVYARGPTSSRLTKQATNHFGQTIYEQKDPIINGDSPQTVNTSGAPPILFPPVLRLIPLGYAGYLPGWYGITYAYGIGDLSGAGYWYVTHCAPLSPIQVGTNQQVRVPLDMSIPNGVTFVPIAMVGPYSNENAIYSATEAWGQTIVFPNTMPLYKELKGPFYKLVALSFTMNQTFIGREGAHLIQSAMALGLL